MKLVNPDDIVAFIGLNKDADNYPALEVIQQNAEASIAAFLGFDLERVERTVSIPLSGKMIPLQSLPVLSVVSVTMRLFGSNRRTLKNQDFDAVSAGNLVMDIPLVPTDYIITKYGIRTLFDYGTGTAEIVFTGGLAVSAGVMSIPAPADPSYRIATAIRKAATMQIAYEFQRKENLAATQVHGEGGSTSFPEFGLLKAVKEILVEFKHPLTGMI